MAAKKNNNMWVITGIVAVVIIIVLAAFLAVGLHTVSTTPPLSVSCAGASGFGCGYATLSNGTFTVSLGQNSGVTWTQANIFLVISGSPNPTAVPPLPCEQGISTPVPSGSAINVSLKSYSNTNTCAGMPTTTGQIFSGTLWAGYRTSLNGTEQIIQVGTVNVKAS